MGNCTQYIITCDGKLEDPNDPSTSRKRPITVVEDIRLCKKTLHNLCKSYLIKKQIPTLLSLQSTKQII